MKTIAAILLFSLQLTGSALAETNHAEVEKKLEQRQRNLKEKTPLSVEEKAFLKRLLADGTLRKTTDEDLEHRKLEDGDPLSAAMRKSALAKIGDLRGVEDESDKKKRRRAAGHVGGYYGFGHHGPQYGPAYEDTNVVYQPRAPAADIPEKVSMVLEAFQDSRRIDEPIKLTPDTSFLDPGTQYLYSNNPLFNVVFDVPPGANRQVYLINERDRIAVVSGTCTRTDPKTNYVGRAYCQFEYRFLDSENRIEAALMAEGPINKGDINTLSITGGTGIFRRTVGTVILEAGDIRSGNPPIFIPNGRLDLPSNYLAKMFVFMDSVDLELAE